MNLRPALLNRLPCRFRVRCHFLPSLGPCATWASVPTQKTTNTVISTAALRCSPVGSTDARQSCNASQASTQATAANVTIAPARHATVRHTTHNTPPATAISRAAVPKAGSKCRARRLNPTKHVPQTTSSILASRFMRARRRSRSPGRRGLTPAASRPLLAWRPLPSSGRLPASRIPSRTRQSAPVFPGTAPEEV